MCNYSASFMMKEMTSMANDGTLAKAMGSLFTAAILILVALSTSVEGGSVNDCHGVRYAYRERGLDLKDVPRQPRQGKIFSFIVIKEDFKIVGIVLEVTPFQQTEW